MLLRSSSVECLPVHADLAPESKYDGLTGDAKHGPSSLCFNPCRGGSLHLEMQSQPTSKAFSVKASFSESPSYAGADGLLGSKCIRKAQSENDLCSLGDDGIGSSVTPARVAARSFVEESHAEVCTSEVKDESYNLFRLGLKNSRRTVQSLSRRRSLGSFPLELPSIFLNADSDGSDFAIIEEGELTPSSSTTDEVSEEVLIDACVFDKISFPADRTSAMKVNNTPMDNYVENHIPLDMENAFIARAENATTENRDEHSDIVQGLFVGKSIASLSSQQDVLEHSSISSNVLSTGLNGIRGVTLEEDCDRSYLLTRIHHADDMGTVCSGGDGGRGNRPRVITGGGGGNSDPGGLDGNGVAAMEQHYRRMLQKDPGNPLLLRNYAQYLLKVKEDYDRAEEFFQRAILASPSDGELLSEYAKMLWEVKHDSERAADYFERAVQAAPDNSYVMAANASFLWNIDDQEDEEDDINSSSSNLPSGFQSLVSAGRA